MCADPPWNSHPGNAAGTFPFSSITANIKPRSACTALRMARANSKRSIGSASLPASITQEGPGAESNPSPSSSAGSFPSLALFGFDFSLFSCKAWCRAKGHKEGSAPCLSLGPQKTKSAPSSHRSRELLQKRQPHRAADLRTSFQQELMKLLSLRLTPKQ